MLIVREPAGLGMRVWFVSLDTKANLFPSHSRSLENNLWVSLVRRESEDHSTK